jgi:hypothetical protein
MESIRPSFPPPPDSIPMILYNLLALDSLVAIFLGQPAPRPPAARSPFNNGHPPARSPPPGPAPVDPSPQPQGSPPDNSPQPVKSPPGPLTINLISDNILIIQPPTRAPMQEEKKTC